MFDGFLAMFMVVITFGALYYVYRYANKMSMKGTDSPFGKTLASFPVSYKTMGHIVKVGDKYYFCCEGCGIVEIDYSANLDKAMSNDSFQSIMASQMSKLNEIVDTKVAVIKDNIKRK